MSKKDTCCISFRSAVSGCSSLAAEAGLLAAVPPPSLLAHVWSCSPLYATFSSPEILFRTLRRLRHNRKKPQPRTTKTGHILTKPEITPGWGQRHVSGQAKLYLLLMVFTCTNVLFYQNPWCIMTWFNIMVVCWFFLVWFGVLCMGLVWFFFFNWVMSCKKKTWGWERSAVRGLWAGPAVLVRASGRSCCWSWAFSLSVLSSGFCKVLQVLPVQMRSSC